MAHDDDLLKAILGLLIMLIEKGCEVVVVVVTDGRNSHLMKFGQTENPTPAEVSRTRREEFLEVMAYVGLEERNIHFLDWEDAHGDQWRKDPFLRQQILEILEAETPDFLYFPGAYDQHVDHGAVHSIVASVLEALKEKPRAFNLVFRPPVKLEGPEYRNDTVSNGSERLIAIDISEVLDKKMHGLFMMQSLILPDPYSWDQSEPIIVPQQLAHALKAREFLTEYNI